MRGRARISVRRMMLLVAVVALALSLGTGSRTRYLSCHLCHNRKQVESRLFLGLPFASHETMETRFPAAVDHRHSWWEYARSLDENVLGLSVASKPHRYVDGSRAPDGRP